jgi:hypothetical protein
MNFQNSKLSMGDGTTCDEYQLLTVDQDRIRKMRQLADQLR